MLKIGFQQEAKMSEVTEELSEATLDTESDDIADRERVRVNPLLLNKQK